MESLLGHIRRHIPIHPEEEEQIRTAFFLKKVKRADILQKAGQSCSHIYFVSGGMLRAYHLDQNGKEYTVMFAITGWWITDMHCFLNGLPAMVSIEALEDSQLLGISKDNLDILFEQVPSFNVFFRKLMEKAYCREQLRVLNNLSQPAIVRYHDFKSKYPKLTERLSVKQTASYLGITPEFLSSLRSKS